MENGFEILIIDSGMTRELLFIPDIARAKGMALIAEKTGLGRTSLYKALSPDGHLEFETILKVIDALGLQLCVTPL